MRHTPRRATATALIAAVALTLGACSSDDSDDPGDPKAPQPQASAPAPGGAAAPGAGQQPPAQPQAAVPPAAAPGTGGSYYVALGDSYAAGVKIPETVPDSPPSCSRSRNNYPHLVATQLGVPTFTDVTCGGATTADFAAAQTTRGDQGIAPTPQFDALGTQTKLVTVGIGGNDIGFSEIMTTCVLSSGVKTSPNPCKDAFTKNGQDVLQQRIDATGRKIDTALATIRQKSPQARILLVGYPAILPETGGCPDQLPIAAGDLDYLRGVIRALNTMIAKSAQTGNATYVDTYGPGIGHDVCQPAGTKWVEGILPESPAAQAHPNALGHKGMAAVVAAAAGRT